MFKLTGTPGLSGATTPETPAVEVAEAATSLLGEKSPQSMLVMSGGEGYIDFRVGKLHSDTRSVRKSLLFSTNLIIGDLFLESFYSNESKFTRQICTAFFFIIKAVVSRI